MYILKEEETKVQFCVIFVGQKSHKYALGTRKNPRKILSSTLVLG